jgi:hypothetical protein
MNDAELVALFVFTWVSQAVIAARLMRCPNKGCCMMELIKRGTTVDERH